MRSFKRVSSIVSILLLFAFMYFAYAIPTDPTGPSSITRDSDSRFNASSYTPIVIRAEAGNVTHLTVTSLTQTQTWQGYYGDISGNITLDDANNFTFYSWTLAEPQGEIYASNSSSVTWSKIRCVNYTQNASDSNINLSILEIMYGLNPDDVDGVNETFYANGLLRDQSTPHPSFYVGQYAIGSGTCPATAMNQNDTTGTANFIEVLLTDNSSIVFTALLENRTVGGNTELYGYNSQITDFQMLVGDNGHNGNTAATSYYFFVELE